MITLNPFSKAYSAGWNSVRIDEKNDKDGIPCGKSFIAKGLTCGGKKEPEPKKTVRGKVFDLHKGASRVKGFLPSPARNGGGLQVRIPKPTRDENGKKQAVDPSKKRGFFSVETGDFLDLDEKGGTPANPFMFRRIGGINISVSGKTSAKVALDPTLSKGGHGDFWDAHLYGQNTGWKWHRGQQPALGKTKSPQGDDYPALISVSKGMKGQHYYALEYDSGGAETHLRYYTNKTSEPRNTITARGQLVLGKVVGTIRTSSGQEHLVFDKIQVQPMAEPPKRGMADKPARANSRE